MAWRPWWNLSPHGTDAGYQRCKKRPRGACESCRHAHARDMRFRRAMQRRSLHAEQESKP